MIVLESDRLLFRLHQPSDLDAFCAMEADPDVRRYVGGSPRTRAAAEQKFRPLLKPPPNRLGLWAAIYKPDSLYIGRAGLYPHFASGGNTVPDEAAISFYIDRAYWGRGLATEAARAFIDFGFSELNLSRIVTTVDARNDASSHILTSLGFAHFATEIGDARTFYKFALERPEAT
jgi:[ribosomal protein S5]-alanine N-acetyltransferase